MSKLVLTFVQEETNLFGRANAYGGYIFAEDQKVFELKNAELKWWFGMIEPDTSNTCWKTFSFDQGNALVNLFMKLGHC